MKGFAAPAPTVQSSEAATQGPKLYFGGDDETRTQKSAFGESVSEIVLNKRPISPAIFFYFFLFLFLKSLYLFTRI
jgi:hypothetical protein